MLLHPAKIPTRSNTRKRCPCPCTYPHTHTHTLSLSLLNHYHYWLYGPPYGGSEFSEVICMGLGTWSSVPVDGKATLALLLNYLVQQLSFSCTPYTALLLGRYISIGPSVSTMEHTFHIQARDHLNFALCVQWYVP